MALKRGQISQETLTALNSALQKQDINSGRSPLTAEGKERGIKIFRTSDYENSMALIYLPNMPEMYDTSGKRVKWHEKVVTRQLRKLGVTGDRNFAGTFRTLEGTDVPTELKDAGITGDIPALQDYISKGYDLVEAERKLIAVNKFQVEDYSTLSETDVKALHREAYAYLPIENAVEDYYFPVVVIELEKDAKGNTKAKPALYPLLDEDGNEVKGKKTIRGELQWYKASKKTFEERLAKAVEVLGLEDDETFEGRLFLFNYKITEEAKKKAGSNANAVMQSANSLAINHISAEGLWEKVYQLATKQGLFEAWDEQANENYGPGNIEFDLTVAEILTDEEITSLLDRNYKGIDALIAKVNALVEAKVKVLNGEVEKPEAKSALDNALAGGDDDDDTLELDFGTDDED